MNNRFWTVPASLAAVLLGLLSAASVALAHGNITSNVGGLTFEQAPPAARFLAEVDIDLSTASAQIRHLGENPEGSAEYLRRDVPTGDLSPLGPSVGVGREFAFTLPALAAGVYAVDWKATPVGDHVNESTEFFTVSKGASTPDPVPAVPGGSSPNGQLPVYLVAVSLAVGILATFAAALLRGRRP